MKKQVIRYSNIGSALIILSSLGTWESIAFFLMAGVVPGTNITLSPLAMIALLSTASAACLYASLHLRQNTATPPVMPKRRYGKV